MSWKRFVFGTDSHGDKIDRDCERAFLAFVKEFDPHLKIHGGDALDLRPWRTNASPEERLEHVQEDFVAFERFMGDYQPDVWLAGNHDYRLWHECGSANADRAQLCYRIVRDLEERLLPSLKCTLVPYDSRKGIYQLGNVRLLHGYRHGKRPASAHAEMYGPCIHGHNHTVDIHIGQHIDDVRALSVPALAQIDMPYLDKSVAKLKHRQGWAFGWWNEKTGHWRAWHVERCTTTGVFINPRANLPYERIDG